MKTHWLFPKARCKLDIVFSYRTDSKHHTSVSSIHTVHAEDSVDSVSHSSPTGSSAAEHYRLGYQECLSEAMHFLVEVEGYFARDALCVQLISHLQQHCDKILATSMSLSLSLSRSLSLRFRSFSILPAGGFRAREGRGSE
jgi:hypothetical protein